MIDDIIAQDIRGLSSVIAAAIEDGLRAGMLTPEKAIEILREGNVVLEDREGNRIVLGEGMEQVRLVRNDDIITIQRESKRVKRLPVQCRHWYSHQPRLVQDCPRCHDLYGDEEE
jgi:hypothetical protein